LRFQLWADESPCGSRYEDSAKLAFVFLVRLLEKLLSTLSHPLCFSVALGCFQDRSQGREVIRFLVAREFFYVVHDTDGTSNSYFCGTSVSDPQKESALMVKGLNGLIRRKSANFLVFRYYLCIDLGCVIGFLFSFSQQSKTLQDP